MLTAELLDRSALGELLAQAGYPAGARLEALPGGGNNRVYQVTAGSREPLLAKHYFRHPADPRDRLGHEVAFLRFAWGRGLRSVPRPIAESRAAGVALFEFVPGRLLEPGEVGAGAVRQALDFYRAVNAERDLATAVPDAVEACFSLADHLGTVSIRLARLDAIEGALEVRREAAAFVRGPLAEAWRRVEDDVRECARRLGLGLDEPIPSSERRLSPSDFGFHNALALPDGRLVFIDFEYAGWDDPAKLVSDFLCQSKRPVPAGLGQGFLEAVAAGQPDPELSRARFELLLPVHRTKWSCLFLNEFLPTDGARRRFAARDVDLEPVLEEQLEKARRNLAHLQREGPSHGPSHRLH